MDTYLAVIPAKAGISMDSAVIPAKAGISMDNARLRLEIPAFAGTTIGMDAVAPASRTAAK